jgi:hypothetical protein
MLLCMVTSMSFVESEGPCTTWPAKRFTDELSDPQDAIRARVEDGLLTVLVPKRTHDGPTPAARKDTAARTEDQQRFRSR